MTMASGAEVDERLVAKAALDGAEEHLRSLCASHASTFVSVERRGAKLEALLKELQSSISTVLENHVAPSQEALEQDTLGQLSENHRLRRRTLLQHSSLLELLELPSLMDACVRSNLYQEALSIASFANALERRQGNNNVVRKVVDQIRTRQVDLRRHLIGRLKQTVTMPECLEIVTSLRRLNSIASENAVTCSEHAELVLQLDFLEARDTWLDAALRESFFDVLEQYRARVFEIATQFHAIFRASAASTPLLNMWTTRRIQIFLSLLKQHSFADSASLRDAWEASVFFATSMGRLGADFSPLLGKLFADKMIALVTTFWTDGLRTLSETLTVCRNAGVASPLVSSIITTEVVSSSTDVEDGQPPRVLLALPPLARLVNSFLVGLNELRRCLFPSMFGELRKHLNEFLMETVVILESNERAVKAPGLRGDATQLRQAASQMLEMVQIVEPYLRGALELALGDKKTAKQYLETEKAQEQNMEEVPQEVDDEEEGDERMQEEESTAEEGAIDEPSVLRETLPTDELRLDDSKAGNGMAATNTEEAVAQEDDIAPQGDGWDDF